MVQLFYLFQTWFPLRFPWKLTETAQHSSQFRINVSWFSFTDELGVVFTKVPLLNMILHTLEEGEENPFAQVSRFPAFDGANPLPS